MNRFFLFFSFLFLLTFSCSQQEPLVGSLDQQCPLPQTYTPAQGNYIITKSTKVGYPEGNQALQRSAELLAAGISEASGLNIPATSRPGRHAVVLSLDPTATEGLEGFQAEEGYSLSVSPERIEIKAATEKGVFYGVQSLLRALPVNDGRPMALAAAQVKDWPRFAFRGFMVDVGRHYFSPEYLKKLIDIMALHGINEFHWHLTEDQGWRLPVPGYPRLTEVGSVRKGTITEPGSGVCDNVPVSGYYTADEIKDIVAYAAERYIEVIPEVDLPGHMMAALASYPELGCTGGPYEVEWRFGVFEDVLCAGKDATLQFAKDVLGTVMDLFPSRYIHIGGDECPKDRWKKCPHCQARIKALGLKPKGGKSAEEQLQTWFMGEVEKVILDRGRKMLAWDEILEGTPAPTTTVMGWTSPEASRRAASEGFSAIVCPIQHLYFSNPRINRMTGLESIGRVYNLDPLAGLSATEASRILGLEACIWTEWVADGAKMEWEMLPRIAALAELQWSSAESRDMEAFLPRLRHMTELYTARGWNWKEDIAEAWNVKK